MSKIATPQKKANKAKKIFTESKVMENSEPDIKGVDKIGAEAPPLNEFFLSCIKDIYWAEKHLVKSLPKMQKSASSDKLKTAIENHLAETKQHVVRLEKIFDLLNEKPQAKKCDAMEGITMEGEEIIEETQMGTATRDVGIILASQKVEHYEIATYGGLAQLATILNKEEIVDLLRQTLEEEKSADQKLTEIAEKNINYQASVE